MEIMSLIRQHNLKVADVIVLVSKDSSFPKHYAFYMHYYNGRISFLANTTKGVRVIQGQELTDFIAQYEIVDVERHCKTDRQRHYIINRALSRLGEKKYNLIFNNCEHFKNWVLHGASISKQVKNVAAGLFISGAVLATIGFTTKKKGLQRAGLIIMVSPLIIVAIALIISSIRKSS